MSAGTWRELGIISIALVVPSCTNFAALEKPGSLARTWTEKFRQFQINPVFPPREDFQVGDIYLLCDSDRQLLSEVDTKTPAPVPISSLVYRHADAGSVLSSYYSSSISLPAAPNSAGGSKSLGMPQQADMFKGGATDRLRNVSLPEFFSVTVTGADVGALIPTGSVLVGLGISSEDVKSTTVSVSSSGSYGLPLVELLGLLNGVNVEAALALQDAYSRAACQTNPASFVAISEVYAAYAIDVQVNLKSEAAGRLQAGITLADESRQKKVFDALGQYFGVSKPDPTKPDPTKPDPTKPDPTKPDPTKPDPIKDQNKASTPKATQSTDTSTTKPKEVEGTNGDREAELVKSLTALLTSSTQNSQLGFPGVVASVRAGSLGGITLTRTFTNPVVIGYKGFRVRFDKDGTFLKLDPQSGEGPPAAAPSK